MPAPHEPLVGIGAAGPLISPLMDEPCTLGADVSAAPSLDEHEDEQLSKWLEFWPDGEFAIGLPMQPGHTTMGVHNPNPAAMGQMGDAGQGPMACATSALGTVPVHNLSNIHQPSSFTDFTTTADLSLEGHQAVLRNTMTVSEPVRSDAGMLPIPMPLMPPPVPAAQQGFADARLYSMPMMAGMSQQGGQGMQSMSGAKDAGGLNHQITSACN